MNKFEITYNESFRKINTEIVFANSFESAESKFKKFSCRVIVKIEMI